VYAQGTGSRTQETPVLNVEFDGSIKEPVKSRFDDGVYYEVITQCIY
jgi:hypothetical protein